MYSHGSAQKRRAAPGMGNRPPKTLHQPRRVTLEYCPRTPLHAAIEKHCTGSLPVWSPTRRRRHAGLDHRRLHQTFGRGSPDRAASCRRSSFIPFDATGPGAVEVGVTRSRSMCSNLTRVSTTVIACIQQIPQGEAHSDAPSEAEGAPVGGEVLDVQEISATGEDYLSAVDAVHAQVPDGWRVLFVRRDGDAPSDTAGQHSDPPSSATGAPAPEVNEPHSSDDSAETTAEAHDA